MADVVVPLELHVGIDEPVDAESDLVDDAAVDLAIVQVRVAVASADLPGARAEQMAAAFTRDPVVVLERYHARRGGAGTVNVALAIGTIFAGEEVERLDVSRLAIEGGARNLDGRRRELRLELRDAIDAAVNVFRLNAQGSHVNEEFGVDHFLVDAIQHGQRNDVLQTRLRIANQPTVVEVGNAGSGAVVKPLILAAHAEVDHAAAIVLVVRQPGEAARVIPGAAALIEAERAVAGASGGNCIARPFVFGRVGNHETGLETVVAVEVGIEADRTFHEVQEAAAGQVIQADGRLQVTDAE